MDELLESTVTADTTPAALSPAEISIISPDAGTIFARLATEQFESVRRQITLGLKVAKRPGLTPAVADRLRAVSPHPAVVIRCEPFEGAIPQMCFRNAQLIADLHGGSVMCGWTVWEERAYLALEYHAVWVQPGRGMVCVTPTLLGEDSVLFVPEQEHASIPADWLPDPAKLGVFVPLVDDERVVRACRQMTTAVGHCRKGGFEYRRLVVEANRLLDAYERTLANRERRQKEKAARKRRRRRK
jgi:hypothetical protein